MDYLDTAKNYFLGRWRKRQKRRILGTNRLFLILGHMRAGSSLLVHLLANHRQIGCYGESHLTYWKPEDFIELRNRCTAYTDDPKAWVGDKILHAYHTPHAAQLFRELAECCIIIYRKPEPSIRSMVKMAPENRSIEGYNLYYIRRLVEIETTCRSMPEVPAFSIDYDTLTTRTADVLAALTRFMGLEEPLAPEYKLLDVTGVPGTGDPSSRIFSGKVMPPAESANNGTDIAHPESHIVFEEFLEFANGWCEHIPPSAVCPR